MSGGVGGGRLGRPPIPIYLGELLGHVLAGSVLFVRLADSAICASVVLYTSMTTGKTMGRRFVCS